MTDSTTVACPHCGKAFSLDESGYTALLAQVRDQAFKAEVADRERLMEQAHGDAVRLAEEQVRQQMAQQAATEREQAAEQLAQAKADAAQQVAAVQAQVAQLQAQLKAEQDGGRLQLENAQAQAKADAAQQQAQLEGELAKVREQLAAQQQRAATEQELAVAQALADMRAERDGLAAQVELAQAKAQQAEAEHVAQLEEQERTRRELLKMKDDELERLRDMKARQSTKMLGESLEQHCETEFDKVRAIAFPRATFGKDNQVVDGTKGDYVFRESDEEGVEFLSIMFEMKNEDDATARKRRNSEFFAKLDKDRAKKGCEYAILVSLLEAESEYYNQGIVEVTDYPKMYVTRPQFFVPLIGLLRNMALASLADRRQLAALQNRDYDITRFEDKLDRFREGFGKNMDLASRKFEKALDDIDKSIAALQRVREELLSSQRNLGYANDKLEGLTVKRLTHGNPTMKAKFDEARKAAEAGQG